MDNICKQIIQKLSSSSELAIIEEDTIKLININKIKDLSLLLERYPIFISNNSKLLKYANLYTKSKIISYGKGGYYSISHKHYLKDGIMIEISQNNLPFISLKLKLYSSYLVDKVLASFLYLLYSGYSKYELSTKLKDINFKDYENYKNITKIKYHSINDLKEILMHIYTYDKRPVIILKHTSSFPGKASRLVSLFASVCYLVGNNNTLYDLSINYLNTNYEIAFSVKDALKNASKENFKSIYILLDS